MLSLVCRERKRYTRKANGTWNAHPKNERKKRDAPDRIPSAQSDPLRNRPVLLLGFGELLLRAEGFVGLDVCRRGRKEEVSFGEKSSKM